MVKTLKDVTDDRVRAYVVWLPIFGGDFRGEAVKLSNSFTDKRVSYFIDAGSLTGELWERVLTTQRQIAWDVYLLYGAASNWPGEEPPSPDFWMHQLGGVTKAPRLDQGTFEAKIKEMLAEMKTTQNIDNANGNNRGLRVEFLYFDECPAHEQALENLKAALRESKIRADLVLINVRSQEQSEEVGFQGSPSIRVNGKDLDGRNDGFSYACRVYSIDGKVTAIPSKEFIVEKLRALSGGT
jgi:hypothetical protein